MRRLLSYAYRRVIECRIRAFIASTAGAAGVEYGLILAGIALAIFAIVFQIGDLLIEFFGYLTNQLFGPR